MATTPAGEAVENQERSPDEDAVDLTVVELPRSAVTEPAVGVRTNDGRASRHPPDFPRLQEAVVSATVGGIRGILTAGTALARRVTSSRPVRFVGDVATQVATTLVEDGSIDWRRAGDRAETQLSRVFAVVVPVIVDSLDPDDIIDRVDINALIRDVDIDAMLERVNVDTLLGRVDVDALLDRVDVDALMARVDVEALVERVDIDSIMDRVDVAEISERIRVGNIVAKSTGEVAGSALDLARRQGVGLDAILGRTIDRVLGRNPEDMPLGPAQLDPGQQGEPT